jgi:subtilisin family serine protease
VFHAAGNSDLYDIVRAVYYAADNGAKVINMSFSLPDPSESLSEAIEYAASRRVIVIASAGNEGREGKTWPAAHSSVIGVGSTDNYDIRSSFSNFGACSILAAPGEALVTAYPGNNYAGVWGTSFSAALVSGAVAAMLPLRPTLSRTRALEALAKAEPVSQGLGKGRLDLYRALRYLDD